VRSWPYTSAGFFRRRAEKGRIQCPLIPWVHSESDSEFDEEWWRENRRKGAGIVARHLKVLPEHQQRADVFVGKMQAMARRWANATEGAPVVLLGLHMRGTDKGAGRQITGPEAFIRYAESFVRGVISAGAVPALFLATDDGRFRRTIRAEWPRSLRGAIFAQQSKGRLTYDGEANFVQFAKDHHSVNLAILQDMLVLARGDMLLHGKSSVSEGVHFLAPHLHEQSANLDYAKGIPSPEEFQQKAHGIALERGADGGGSGSGAGATPASAGDSSPTATTTTGRRIPLWKKLKMLRRKGQTETR